MTLKLSLSTTSAPRSSVVEVDVGVDVDPHLAPLGEDVDGAVVVLADHHAVGGRRLGELVDLVAQRGDVLARLPQRVAQLLVLGHRLGQLALGLEQPLLEGAHPLRGVGQLASAGGRSPRPEARSALAGGPGRLRRGVRHGDSSFSTGNPAATRRRRSHYIPATTLVGRAVVHTHVPGIRFGDDCFHGRRRVKSVVVATATTGAHIMKVWIDQDLCTGDGLCERSPRTSSRCSTTGWPTSRKATRSTPRPRATRRAPRAWPTSPTASSTP